jgi:PAS domain-containing protein
MVEMDNGSAKTGMARQALLQRAILDGMPDGILAVDPERRVVSVNERFFTVWGIPQPVGALDALSGTPETALVAQILLRVADPDASRPGSAVSMRSRGGTTSAIFSCWTAVP